MLGSSPERPESPSVVLFLWVVQSICSGDYGNDSMRPDHDPDQASVGGSNNVCLEFPSFRDDLNETRPGMGSEELITSPESVSYSDDSV